MCFHKLPQLFLRHPESTSPELLKGGVRAGAPPSVGSGQGTNGPSRLSSGSAEVLAAAILDPGAEAVPAAEGPERSVHGRHQLLQPHPHGHQLSAGEG